MRFLSIKSSIVTTISLLLFWIPAIAQNMADYKIYNSLSQKVISLDELAKNLDHTDAIFYGEEHNDSVGHLVEAALLQKLAALHPQKTALSMEMFETDCQEVLNEYLTGLIREKNFLVDARCWPNYTDYRPMIEFAKNNNIPVIAANAPSRYTNMVSRMGLPSLQKLDQLAKSYLPPLPIDTATGAYLKKFDETMGGHGMSGMQLYQAQNLWDATMGWSIANFLKAHPGFTLLQINGGFHSEEKLGNVAQLKKYFPKAAVKNIAAFAADDFEKPDWDKLKKLADFIILTNNQP